MHMAHYIPVVSMTSVERACKANNNNSNNNNDAIQHLRHSLQTCISLILMWAVIPFTC